MLEDVILLMTYLIKYLFQINQDLNLSVFRMIVEIIESKTLTKHISCECKRKFDGRKCNSINGGITVNVDVYVKNVMNVTNIMFGILLHVIVKMENM